MASSWLTVGLDGVEAAVLEVGGAAAELRVALAAGDLQVPPGDPLGHPAQAAVTAEEAAAQRQSAQRRVEVRHGPLRHAPQRVAVQRQQRQRGRARERRGGQLRQQVEADVQYLLGQS